MPGLVWVMAAAMVIFAGVIAYAMARRYGWGLAVLLPVLALIALIAMRWQKEGLTLSQGLSSLIPMLIFAAPVLLGSLIGIAVARLRRR